MIKLLFGDRSGGLWAPPMSLGHGVACIALPQADATQSLGFSFASIIAFSLSMYPPSLWGLEEELAGVTETRRARSLSIIHYFGHDNF